MPETEINTNETITADTEITADAQTVPWYKSTAAKIIFGGLVVTAIAGVAIKLMADGGDLNAVAETTAETVAGIIG